MAKNQLPFTIANLEALRPSADGKRTYYYDTKTDGLEVCVNKSGSKTFAAYKWINGGPKRVVLGRFTPDAIQIADFESKPLSILGKNPYLNVEQARRLCRAVLGELSSGKDPGQTIRHGREEPTLGEMFSEYLENYAKEHTKTWKVMEECFHRYLSLWKNRKLSDIRKSEVQALINQIGRENGHTTANRTLELLRAVINKGIHWGLFKHQNPAVGIQKFKLKPRARFLHPDEIDRLMKKLNEEASEDLRDYVLLSLSTGARKSNVLSTRWEHVDLKNKVWLIPDTKNGTEQKILLTNDEHSILARRHANRTRSEWVFPSDSATGYLLSPKKGWTSLLKEARIKDLHMHDLRRSLGSYMAMAGVSLSVIGNALNHKDVSTTRRVYAHSAEEAERQARELAHEQMFEKKKKPPPKVVKLAEHQKKKSVEF
jgi:integrase